MTAGYTLESMVLSPCWTVGRHTAFVEFNAMGSGLGAHSLLAYLHQAEAFFRETRVLQNIWIQARASMDRLPMTVSASYVLCF